MLISNRPENIENGTMHALRLLSSREWQVQWDRLPNDRRSVFFSPQYVQIFEDLGYGTARCFFKSDGRSTILYPILQRALRKLPFVNEDIFDIEGPYGLNGAAIILSENSEAFLKEFAREFHDVCVNEKIIAEFSRLNPMLPNQERLSHWSLVQANRVIAVDLTIDDFLYGSYEPAVRNKLKKAERFGVQVESFSGDTLNSEKFESFLRIYEETMQRNDAESFYFFSTEFFKALKEKLPQMARWFFASIDGNVVSVEIVLNDSTYCYSFLGGTTREHMTSGANTLLKHHIHLYFKDQGLRKYCIGGGLKDGDRVFEYKKAFSKAEPVPFFIAKALHEPSAYDGVVTAWSRVFPEKVAHYQNFLLKYWK